MSVSRSLQLLCLAGVLAVCLPAGAESLASSASSAGSASSGSISDSLSGSSNSSNNDKKVANGPYRIIDVAATPERAGMARVTMLAADDTHNRVVLDLPQPTFDKQRLGAGDMVYAQNRAYGIEFARNDTGEAFFLVLADDWYRELASRPVGL